MTIERVIDKEAIRTDVIGAMYKLGFWLDGETGNKDTDTDTMEFLDSEYKVTVTIEKRGQ